jgi:hypothetical protein
MIINCKKCGKKCPGVACYRPGGLIFRIFCLVCRTDAGPYDSEG